MSCGIFSGAGGTRVVEVVRATAGSSPRPTAPRRDFQIRAYAWDDGFPAKAAHDPRPAAPLPPAPATAPVTHELPMWQPSRSEAAEEQMPAPIVDAAPKGARRKRSTTQAEPAPARRVADPFDANDDGANCVRCGYVIEPKRERLGLMTRAKCGSE